VNPLKKESGFTLIEVLIGLFIIMVGLLAHAAFTVTVIRENNNSGNYTEASALAQDKLEELINLPFTNNTTHAFLKDVNAGNNSAAGLLTITAADVDHREVGINEFGNFGGFYTRTWNVWDVAAVRKDIAVIVSWQSAGGSVKKTSYTTTLMRKRIEKSE